MKSITEIEKQMNRPAFKDMFGNDIEPNDIIALTYTSDKRIHTYIVTDEWKNNIVRLIDFNNNKFVRSFDVSKLGDKWENYNCLKITNCVPQLHVSTVQDTVQTRKDLLDKRAIDRKNVIQKRMLLLFAKNNKTNTYGIMLTEVKSQPGKVIGNTELFNCVSEIKSSFPDYTFAIYNNEHNMWLNFKDQYKDRIFWSKALRNSILSSRHDFDNYSNSASKQRLMMDNLTLYSVTSYDITNKFIPVKKINKSIELVNESSYTKYYNYSNKNNTNYYFEVPSVQHIYWSNKNYDPARNVPVSHVMSEQIFNLFQSFTLHF